MVLRTVMRLTVACALVLSVALVASAQKAVINGTLTDATGAVVPGVAVVANLVDTNLEREAISNSRGFYSLPDLTPGVYNLMFRKSGFRVIQIAAVTLTVDQALTLDAKLEVGAVSASITVGGGQVAPINTTDAQVSNVVTEKQIEDLPLILRDPYQLILLSPGSTQTNTGSGGFSINGSRDRNNNFLLDGTNNNDPGVPGYGLLSLNPDSTQEFRVITTNYLPEFGRNSGSIIDIVTRSGTNQFHGDTYYFGRWDALGARDYFNAPDTGPKNPYERSTFGASIGGPAIKNKFFFFFNYEGNRFITSNVGIAVVPTAAFKTGILTYTDPTNGSVNVDVSTPTSTNNAYGLPLDPQIQKILAFYPTPPPGAPAVLPGVSAAYFFANPDLLNADNYTAKVDYNITSNNVLSVRYVGSSGNESNAGSTNVLPGIGGIAVKALAQSVNAHLATTFSPSWVNDLYATANRVKGDFVCPGANIIDSLNLVGTDEFGRGRDWELPGFTPIACSTLGDSDGQDRPFGTYDEGDNLTWVKGRHTIKFGFEFVDDYSNGFQNFSTRPVPTFNNFTNFGVSALTGGPDTEITNPTVQDAVWGLLGAVSQESESQFFNTAGTRVSGNGRGFRERDIYGYWQDQFKIFSNFTFNYGLRYEWSGVPWVVGDQLSSASPAALAGPAPIVFQVVTRGGPNPLYVNDVKGFEPRIGFAWDPFKTGKTSIRGGYGVFRDRNFFNITGNTRDEPPFTAPFVNNAFVDNVTVVGGNVTAVSTGDQISNIPLPASLPPGFDIPQGNFATPVTINPNFHVAYIQQWNFGIQRELPGRLVLEVNYVGNNAHRLMWVIDGNPPIPSLVAELRSICASFSNPLNTTGCVPGNVAGENLYNGFENGVLPFDAVHNNAAFHSYEVTSLASSNYNGLQITVSRQFSNGMSFQANYTWAHAIDDASDPLRYQVGELPIPADTFDLRAERGNSSFDVRHRFVLNYIVDLPFGRGTSRLNNGVVGWLLGGWAWSGIVTAQTGFPYDIFAIGDDSNGTGAPQRADYNPHAPKIPKAGSDPLTGPNPGFFSFPALGGPGNLPRNHFYGPSFVNFDAVLAKTTKFTENVSLEFRAESYNLFNHPNFGQPDVNLDDFGGTFMESIYEIGRNDGTTGARQFQFGLKLHF